MEVRKFYPVVLWLLFAYVFITRLISANFDVAPAQWDEQYHMLVAKNLTDNPTMPYLISNHVFESDSLSWTHGNVWMHKPPLFTYLMAGSMKLFGPTVLAGRLPSVVFSALMVFIVFGIGRELGSKQLGVIAAVLWAAFAYNFRLLRGQMPTDQNDLQFIFWIALSLFLFFRYQNHKTLKNAVVLGVVVAMAVLTKWLVGMLVFLPWGVVWLKETLSQRKLPTETKHFFAALFTVFMLVFPWHLYMYLSFPDIYNFEMEYNRKHLFEPVEGHGQPWYFHFEIMDIIYGTVFTITAVPGIFLIKNFISSKFYWQVLLIMGFVYLFFSFAVTKMISFTAILAPLWFLMSGATFVWIYQKMHRRKWGLILCVALFATVINTMHKPTQVLVNVKWEDANYIKRQSHAKIFKEWQQTHDTKKWVLLNYSKFHEPQFMFFTEGVAYSKMPSEEELNKLTSKGYTLVVYDQENDEFSFLNQ